VWRGDIFERQRKEENILTAEKKRKHFEPQRTQRKKGEDCNGSHCSSSLFSAGADCSF
jgi:hypothetical protein